MGSSPLFYFQENAVIGNHAGPRRMISSPNKILMSPWLTGALWQAFSTLPSWFSLLTSFLHSEAGSITFAKTGWLLRD
jgi:hypothetical protein